MKQKNEQVNLMKQIQKKTVCDPDDLTETKPCAGDNGVTNCPIDAKWTAWSEAIIHLV